MPAFAFRRSVIVDFNDLFAAVAAAFGANAMGDMIFAATFAFNQVLQLQGVMSAPAVAPRF